MLDPILLIPLLPLIGAAVNGVAGWKLPRRAVEALACASVGGSFISALWVFRGMQAPLLLRVGDWLTFGWFSAPFTLYFDALSGAMAVMVTGVSFIIHIYSVGYMRGEEGYARYFALLNLFVFSMLVLVLAANLPLMYLGWEGVGFCSYALIGFWYKDPANATAGRKAFIVTRVGDVAFGVALIWLYYFAGTTAITGINTMAQASMPVATATFIGLLILFGAAGKSAQLPLTVWLPDAMAGPTPVSALIHAATMVTAGVYLLMRMFPVIHVSETATSAVAVLGAATAFYAATAAAAQRDIKRVLAYSTISQVGYMVLAVGAGAIPAALFHLFEHAFFKALLFMAAGCVIQAMHEEHDIFKMGGLMTKMPLVFWCFLAGSLALAAAPGTGGFFSKDEILASLMAGGGGLHTALWAVAELTALITAFYIFRVVFLVFAGASKGEPHPLPFVMGASLVPLALLSVVGGAMNMPAEWHGSARLTTLLSGHGLVSEGLPVLSRSGSLILQAVTAAVFLAGLSLSHHLYVRRPELRQRLAARYYGFVDFLAAGWYLDRLYQAVIVAPYARLAEFLWRRVDEGIIDRFLDGAAFGIARAGTSIRASVTGRASTYILVTAVGAAAILLYFAWRLA